MTSHFSAKVGASLQHAISRDPKDIIFLQVQGTCWCTDVVILLPFPRFHPTVYDHMLLAGQTKDPGSVVSSRFLLYAATFVEDDREVVSSPSAGRRDVESTLVVLI